MLLRFVRAASIGAGRRAPTVFAASLVIGVVTALGASAAVVHTSKSHASTSTNTWTQPGANLQNTRDVKGPITSSNVSQLTEAWAVPIKGAGAFGTYATTPVIVNGVVYTQDIDSNVYAIDLATGKLLWYTPYSDPDAGPNGITVSDGVVYGATAHDAFALQAATGEQLWSKRIVNSSSGIDMAPGVDDGTVYVSTVPGNVKHFSGAQGQAILWALNAKTGKTIWKWNEAPTQDWSKAEEAINGGSGQWYPPSFDANGDVYVGTANPTPVPGTNAKPFGSSRPGPDLYTDSIVKLNHKTGKVDWYYQLTPHDIDDWDLEDSPVLTTVNGKHVVIGAGKAGIVVELNQKTGDMIWQTPVGKHNGHDNDGLLTLAEAKKKLKFPYTVYPGILGGVESPLASDGTNVYAAVNNLGSTYTNNLETGIKTGNVFKGTGVMTALSQKTGKPVWTHSFTSSPYGSATVSNDVVFTTTFDGTLWALSTKTGQVLWSQQLSAGTNATVAVAGGYVITAASLPLTATQTAEIVAYKLPGS
jgi:outer membrane protein assembly factor BamB